MPDRFTSEVATVLAESGWAEGRSNSELVPQLVEYVEDRIGGDGSRTTSFAVAEEILREFSGLVVIQDGPGIDLRRRPFVIDPTQVAASCETLADLGAVLDRRLFPIGMEGDHESIVAVAEDGHVFALDHAGEWHLGNSFDEALVTLITGTQPPRVDSSGTW